MVVNSLNFWLVFPWLFLFYWLIPSKMVAARKWFLILVSYAIYMTFQPVCVLVLLGVTVITYWGGICIDKASKWRKRINALFICLALAPLVVLKYSRFLCEVFSDTLGWMGGKLTMTGLNWFIPMGISFFTLQAISYLVDVYYKKIEVEKSFADHMLFVSFFPQIVCGPISKASELFPQFRSKHQLEYTTVAKGLKMVLWGMFMKVAVADRAGIYVDFFYGNYDFYRGSDYLISAILYSIQIYADFAGYTLMATGIAKTLDIDIINNFNRPYFSVSVTEFWGRWHISLSRWLKDYIYIPLGGNRCSRLRNYVNIMITFFVSGLWHGASWSFVVWGMIHGVVQVIEKFFGVQRLKSASPWVRVSRITLNFMIVTFAWIFFRTPTLETAFKVISKIATDGFSKPTDITYTSFPYFVLVFPILLAYDIWKEYCSGKCAFFETRFFHWCFALFLAVMIVFLGVLNGGQFIYASF